MKNIYSEEFKQLSKESKSIIIDVRTSGEIEEGVIPGAIHIDMFSPDFMHQIRNLEKDSTYLVYCRSGNRSSSACGAMASLGFNNVYNLIGGIGAWTGTISSKQ